MEMRRKNIVVNVIVGIAVLLWAGQVFSAEKIVLTENKTFSAFFLKVDSNDIVSFVNDDSVTHVLSFKGTKTALTMRTIAPGTTQAIRFSKPGVYDVQCEDRPEMKLTMLVSFVNKVKMKQN